METDIEAYTSTGKKDMLMKKIVAYIAVLLTMLAFIFSCIGLNMGTQKNLERTLYTFSFPYFNQIPPVAPGVVVSLDPKGYVFTGAGTTISQNVTQVPTNYVNDVTVVAWNTNLVFAGSSGRIVAYEISYDDIPVDHSEVKLPQADGKERKVESMYKIGDNNMIVVGSGYMLLYTITITEKNGRFDVNYEQIEDKKFTEFGEKSYSHCDDLGSDRRAEMLACTYEESPRLITRVVKFEGSGKTMRMILGKPVDYAAQRRFHGIAGLGVDGYVIAAAGSLYNETTRPEGPLRVRYVKITKEGLQIGNWSEITHMTNGFFSIDNMNERGAVICYNRLVSEGITCTGVDTYGDLTITFGSSLQVNKGGASSSISRTKLQILNRSTFALMYADANIGGYLVYQMMTFTDAGDLVKNGPAYMVSSRDRNKKIHKHAFGMARWDSYKSAIIELVQADDGDNAFLHTVYIYPRPIGIAGKSFTGGNQIQFGGLWKINNKSGIHKGMKLVPGRMYYTNDRGMLLRGPAAGYAHQSFGTQYITSESDQSLLSLNNRVGIAISETEILLRFN